MSNAIKTTAVTLVYERLRNDIINCDLRPGQKLQIEEMAARYRIGVNPVREALNRLSSEGFVAHREQRGFHVRPVSLAEFRELFMTRIWLDCRALEESIRNRTREWEDALVLAHHRMTRTPQVLDGPGHVRNPDWDVLHSDFHDALLANAGSSWLLRFCAELREQASRYRFLSDAQSEGKRNTPDEHQAIMEAALDGDIVRATSTLREHFMCTMRLLEERYEGVDEVVVSGIRVPAR